MNPAVETLEYLARLLADAGVKLIAYRFRDRDDLESVVAAGVALDDTYIERWCDEWEIRDRWEEFQRSRR